MRSGCESWGWNRYAAAFRENAVTADVLSDLTADDLKELGVAAVGHRRRLLQAIAAVRADDGAESDAPRDSPEPDQQSGSTGERRQLSVMFCDLVGSTERSSRLDPEDLSQMIRAYQARVRETMARFGGFVARYVGDGVLIYFGWPAAQETDAERAVRAALAVASSVSNGPVEGERLQVRIGIATGVVVVGEPIGAGDARQQTAIGETPNRAARLQGLAAPNGVVIDATTRQQVGALFDCRDLGPVELKGLPQPVQVWSVLGESAVENRFEALRATGLAPLIGRTEELELLVRRWQRAQAGEGRVVLLSGEAGIGKSRLTAALREQIKEDAAPVGLLVLLAPPSGQRTASHHRPIAARGRVPAGRYGRSEMGQAGGAARPYGIGRRGRGAARRSSVSLRPRSSRTAGDVSGTEAAANHRGAASPFHRPGAAAAGRRCVRGCPLGGPEQPRPARSAGQ